MTFSKKMIPLTMVVALPMLAAPNAAVAGADPFIGEMSYVGFNYAPRGWVPCDGQLIPVNQNPSLFALLGPTYGGDGRNTFGIPDMRGRVPIHQGQGPGLDNYTLGFKGGYEYMRLNGNQLPQHTHPAALTNASVSNVQASSTLHVNSGIGNSTPGGKYLAGAVLRDTSYMYTDAAPNVDLNASSITTTVTSMDVSADISVGIAGAGDQFPLMQPYTVVNCIMAVDGIFPPRQ